MTLIRNWWILALRGVSFLIFGLYFFFYPELTTLLLVRGFVFYAAVDGVICLLIGLLTHGNRWWRAMFVIIGLVDLLVAGVGLSRPLDLEILLFTTFGPFMIVMGLLEIAVSIILWNDFHGTHWLIVLGLIGFLLGLLIVVQPLIDFTEVAELIGVAQMIRGMIGLTIAFNLRENRFGSFHE